MRVVAGALAGGTDAERVPATTSDLATTRDGGFLIAGEGRVRKVDASGTITTVAGTGARENSGDGGPALAAGLFGPWGLAELPDGGFLVSVHNLLRRIGADGVIDAVAGTGRSGRAGDGGPARSAELELGGGAARRLDQRARAADGRG